MLGALRRARVPAAAFLPTRNPFRSRYANLRNHRKIMVVDGAIAFTGGMNIGDEYLGKSPYFGYWRDTHLKIRGPSVLQLQQVFVEDWFYATGEKVTQPEIFPEPLESGNVSAQSPVHSLAPGCVTSVGGRQLSNQSVSGPPAVPETGAVGGRG